MKTPKYLKIASEIDAMIDEGKYPPGSQLPAHRALADELGTTPATVSKAYNVLTEQGRIESHVGRGSFVCEPTSLSQVIQSDTGQETINFSILQPCFDLEHLQGLDKHTQAAMRTTDRVQLHRYAENSGLWQHRETGVVWNQAFGSDNRLADRVLMTNGAQHAISALIECLTQPGDLVAVEARTYPGILSVLNLLGRRYTGIEMDEQGMVAEALDQVCQREKPAMVIVVPSHQNPTGITMPAKRREELAEVIDRHGIWLLEDDIYGFLNAEVVSPITNLIPDRGFYISSLSKALSPGLRCAWVQAPVQQSERLAHFIRASVWLAPPMVFATAASLIGSGDGLKLADRQRQIAVQRHNLAQTVLPASAPCRNSGSYQLWISLPEYWNADEFALAAKEQQLLVSSGRFFNAVAAPVNAVRLSVTAEVRESRFVEGLQAIARLIEHKPIKAVHF